MNDNETRGRLVAQVFYEELEKIALSAGLVGRARAEALRRASALQHGTKQAPLGDYWPAIGRRYRQATTFGSDFRGPFQNLAGSAKGTKAMEKVHGVEKVALALAPFKSMAGHALMGAGAGGVIGGATAGEGNRMSGAAMGAGMGAAAGAGIGHLGLRAVQASGVRKGILSKTDDAGKAAFKAAPEKLEEQVAAGVKTHRDGAKTFADRYGYKPLVRGSPEEMAKLKTDSKEVMNRTLLLPHE